MKSLPIKKHVLIIIIAAVCVAVYIIIFHVPHPVMLSEETILSAGGGTYEVVDEKDNSVKYEYGVGEIFVECRGDDAYAVIDVDDLTEILQSTYCLFKYMPPPYFADDQIYEIGVLTNNGIMHIVIGKEDTYWYRSGDDLYKHQILDSEVLQQRISDALTYY